jgi:hypothetical protein
MIKNFTYKRRKYQECIFSTDILKPVIPVAAAGGTPNPSWQLVALRGHAQPQSGERNLG